jgi:hypothetical protein
MLKRRDTWTIIQLVRSQRKDQETGLPSRAVRFCGLLPAGIQILLQKGEDIKMNFIRKYTCFAVLTVLILSAAGLSGCGWLGRKDASGPSEEAVLPAEMPAPAGAEAEGGARDQKTEETEETEKAGEPDPQKEPAADPPAEASPETALPEVQVLPEPDKKEDASGRESQSGTPGENEEPVTFPSEPIELPEVPVN